MKILSMLALAGFLGAAAVGCAHSNNEQKSETPATQPAPEPAPAPAPHYNPPPAQ